MLSIARRTMSQPTKVANAWAQFLARQMSDLKTEPNNRTSIEDNPYYNKYADKLKKISATIPTSRTAFGNEEMRMKSKLEELNIKLEESRHKDSKDESSTKKRSTESHRTPSYVKERSLNDIVKVELLEKHSSDEIQNIWCQYYRAKEDCIFACIESQTYDLLKRNAENYPIFVFPLPFVNPDTKSEESKKSNYQFVLGQFHNDQIYFTPLIMYQSHGENAPPCLTINHFTDMKQSKGLVLMEGEFDKLAFKSFEAQCLANQVQIFYATQDSKRTELLYRFNQDPGNFDYMDIINLFESLSLEAQTPKLSN